MTDEQQPAEAMSPVAAGAAPAPKPSGWPIAIGIVCVIFGALGSFGGCVMMSVNIFVNKLLAMLEGVSGNTPGLDVQVAQIRTLAQYQMVGIVLAAVSLVLAVLLLVSGFGLLKRRPWSVRSAVTWAVLKLVYSLPSTAYAFMINRAQFPAMEEAAANSPNAPPAGLYSLMGSMSATNVIIGMAWAWALPIFLLVWFYRRKIKEETRTWRAMPDR